MMVLNRPKEVKKVDGEIKGLVDVLPWVIYKLTKGDERILAAIARGIERGKKEGFRPTRFNPEEVIKQVRRIKEQEEMEDPQMVKARKLCDSDLH